LPACSGDEAPVGFLACLASGRLAGPGACLADQANASAGATETEHVWGLLQLWCELEEGEGVTAPFVGSSLASALSIEASAVLGVNVTTSAASGDGGVSGSRRLQLLRTRIFDVSYELASPPGLDGASLRAKAAALTSVGSASFLGFQGAMRTDHGVDVTLILELVTPQLYTVRSTATTTTPPLPAPHSLGIGGSQVAAANAQLAAGFLGGVLVVVVACTAVGVYFKRDVTRMVTEEKSMKYVESDTTKLTSQMDFKEDHGGPTAATSSGYLLTDIGGISASRCLAGIAAEPPSPSVFSSTCSPRSSRPATLASPSVAGSWRTSPVASARSPHFVGGGSSTEISCERLVAVVEEPHFAPFAGGAFPSAGAGAFGDSSAGDGDGDGDGDWGLGRTEVRAKEPTEDPKGALRLSFVVHGLEYPALARDAAARGRFEAAVLAALCKDGAEEGLRPPHIQLRLSPGSVVVAALVAPPGGAEGVRALGARLRSAPDSLRDALDRGLRRAALPEAACSGPLEVGPIEVGASAPSSPQSLTSSFGAGGHLAVAIAAVDDADDDRGGSAVEARLSPRRAAAAAVLGAMGLGQGERVPSRARIASSEADSDSERWALDDLGGEFPPAPPSPPPALCGGMPPPPPGTSAPPWVCIPMAGPPNDEIFGDDEGELEEELEGTAFLQQPPRRGRRGGGVRCSVVAGRFELGCSSQGPERDPHASPDASLPWAWAPDRAWPRDMRSVSPPAADDTQTSPSSWRGSRQATSPSGSGAGPHGSRPGGGGGGGGGGSPTRPRQLQLPPLAVSWTPPHERGTGPPDCFAFALDCT